MSIAKIYTLSRLKRHEAVSLITSGRAAKMNDVAFFRLAGRLLPKVITRPQRPNLCKSTQAALGRLERSIDRWEHSELTMPVALQMKLQSRLQAMSRSLEKIRRTSAAAM